jgi:predicted branched-subunit amino acid permease
MQGSGSVASTSFGVGFAVGLYGISFGALSVAAGLDFWQTQVLSLLMFSGGSQFAFVGVIAGGGLGSVVPALVSAWLIGVRNGFYAIRMSSLLGVTGLMRAVGAQLTIDESTAVASSQTSTKDQRKGFWLTGIAVFIFWNGFTALGALLGDAVGDPSRFGLDAAAAVAFLALVWPQLKSLQSNTVAAIAFLTAVVLSPFLPAGLPVIAAGLVGIVFGWRNWLAGTPKESNS